VRKEVPTGRGMALGDMGVFRVKCGRRQTAANWAAEFRSLRRSQRYGPPDAPAGSNRQIPSIMASLTLPTPRDDVRTRPQ
jgi:hypothetical protein